MHLCHFLSYTSEMWCQYHQVNSHQSYLYDTMVLPCGPTNKGFVPHLTNELHDMLYDMNQNMCAEVTGIKRGSIQWTGKDAPSYCGYNRDYQSTSL